MPDLINERTLIPPFGSGRNSSDENWNKIFSEKPSDYLETDNSRDGRTPYRSGFKRYGKKTKIR